MTRYIIDIWTKNDRQTHKQKLKYSCSSYWYHVPLVFLILIIQTLQLQFHMQSSILQTVQNMCIGQGIV